MWLVKRSSSRSAGAQVRVVQMFWARVLNRARLPHLLRCVPRDAQVALGHRLGWKTVVNLAQPDGAYELDLSRPDDNDAGARLFRAAVDIRGRCVNNLLIDGAPPSRAPVCVGMWGCRLLLFWCTPCACDAGAGG